MLVMSMFILIFHLYHAKCLHQLLDGNRREKRTDKRMADSKGQPPSLNCDYKTILCIIQITVDVVRTRDNPDEQFHAKT